MSKSRVAPASLIPVDFQTITLANSTALGLNTTMIASAQVLDISVETNNARFSFDANSTSPTLLVGVVLLKDTPYRWEGYDGSVVKFQRSTGSSVVSVQGYKYAGLSRD